MPDSSSQIEYLRFLLEASTGPRFLFAVCDDTEEQRALMKQLYSQLENHHAAVLDVRRLAPSDILPAVARISQKDVKSINFVNISVLSEAYQRSLFLHLNFHRDAISEIDLPIVLWMSSESLARFAAAAPDFWSRRSAVVKFSNIPAAERIRRLFSEYKVPELSKFERDMREAFACVSDCEKELHDCLRGDRFSISKIDERIARLQQAISVFTYWVGNGRALQVTLWLWNAFHLEAGLQHKLQSLHYEMRAQPDVLLDDRNEILVQVSTNLGAILEEYRANIVRCCREGRRISLRSRITAEVDSALKLVVPSEESEDILSTTNVSSISHPELTNLDFGAENQLRNRAATELDSYLSGASSNHPPFFGSEELSMLKFLYDNNQSVSAFSEHFGIGEVDAKEKVQELYEKVMLYLGEV